MKWVTLFFINILVGNSSVQSKLEISGLKLRNSLQLIRSPLEVPCNEHVCVGPLSEIYCYGPLLTNAWQFGVEKTCPGEKLKISSNDVLEKFKKLTYPIKKEAFQNFCEDSFEQVNYLELANLVDWQAEPKFLRKIENLTHKKLSAELHQRWKRLARQFTADVIHHPDLYPLLPVKNPFIVPGGRFDVYFYWDTYWIIKGLLVSQMYETTKGIIDNFSGLVNTLGYIPNSGNLQLTRRSQPPLFPHMVWEYTRMTGTYEKRWLDSMDIEMSFWEMNRTVTVGKQQLFVYKTLTNCPRPENFLVDYNLGIKSSNPSSVWRSISSACESGWDFSSRWTHPNFSADLSSLHTDQIIPVDLNVIIANNYRYMASYADHFARFDMSARYREKFEKLSEAIQSVLWDNNLGAWFDYDILLQKKNLNFYPSNVYPLMIPGFEKFSDKVESYIKESGALKFSGGIPSTLPVQSSQQWDFPNVWAPNQHLVIQSFIASNNTFLRQEAGRQAFAFIETVYNGLYNSMKEFDSGIWEKYDARSNKGIPGTGGEYVVQEGFGWTNGAVLDLIWSFRNSQKKLDISEKFAANNSQQSAIVYAAGGFCAFVAVIVIIKALILNRNQPSSEADALLLGDNEEEQDEL